MIPKLYFVYFIADFGNLSHWNPTGCGITSPAGVYCILYVSGAGGGLACILVVYWNVHQILPDIRVFGIADCAISVAVFLWYCPSVGGGTMSHHWKKKTYLSNQLKPMEAICL